MVHKNRKELERHQCFLFGLPEPPAGGVTRMIRVRILSLSSLLFLDSHLSALESRLEWNTLNARENKGKALGGDRRQGVRSHSKVCGGPLIFTCF